MNNKDPDGIEVLRRAKEKCPKCNKKWVYSKRWECPECKEGKGNWKSLWARLNLDEAIDRLKAGKNVGIAALSNDDLIICDIDDWNYVKYAPDTLISKSRKRLAIHCFMFKNKKDNILPINIPTEHGELRSADQYVVAPGSYCTTNKKDIDKEPVSEELKHEAKTDPDLGRYTVWKAKAPIYVTWQDIPEFYRKQKEKVDSEEKASIEIRKKQMLKNKTIPSDGKKSALFNLEINDIVSCPNHREPHPLHNSTTGKNFGICDGLAQCFRHGVSLNAIQFLVVKSGYMNCDEAGTGHKNSNAGSSKVTGDDGSIFHAWLQAKRDNLIPVDDPIPLRAMKYIAKENNLVINEDAMLPKETYKEVIRLLESGEWSG